MPREKLTDKFVQNPKPWPDPGKQINFFDTWTPGLVLRVNYGGAKIWRVMHYKKTTNKKTGEQIVAGRMRKLGRYPIMTLAKAREAAGAFLANPAAALRPAETGSFKTVAENFVSRHVAKVGLRSQKEIERCLKRYVYPVFEDRMFVEINRNDVTELLDNIEDGTGHLRKAKPRPLKGGPRQADAVLAILSKMFNWHQSRSQDYVSPIVRGMRRTNASDRKRKRILNDDEIRLVWEAVEDMGAFASIVRLALLTAQRREFIGTMQWADLFDHVWTLPVENRQKGTGARLELPKLATETIGAQPKISGSPFVFTGGRRRKDAKQSRALTFRAFNSFSEKMDELREKLPTNMPHWTLHDLRRTAKSLMARAGVRPDISERVLGHAIPGVEGVYDRYDYFAEKADALRKLSALVESILLSGENVVPLSRSNPVVITSDLKRRANSP